MTWARKDDRSRSKNEEAPDDADRTFPNRNRPNIIGGLNRTNNSGHWSLNIIEGLNRHHPNIIEGLNWKNNTRHRSLNSPD